MPSHKRDGFFYVPVSLIFAASKLRVFKIVFMGRIFEVRKATMFARWDKMAKQFTRIGKEIVIAVKAAGPDVATNPALRRCFQNAKSVGMPKDRVEAAIKRAMGKDTSNYEEVLYEGYAPHGVALVVETATDNHVRTVANVKSHFNKGHGALGNSGSVSFQFKKMGVFKLKPEGLDIDELNSSTPSCRPFHHLRNEKDRVRFIELYMGHIKFPLYANDVEFTNALYASTQYETIINYMEHKYT